MSEPFFKASDAEYKEFDGELSIGLKKANRVIQERGTVVTGGMKEDGSHKYFGAEPGPIMPNTHRALLINIEPIAKDTAEKIVEDMLEHFGGPMATKHSLDSLIDRARKLKGGEK